MEGLAPYLGPALGMMMSTIVSTNSTSSVDIAQSLVEKVPGFSDIQKLVKSFTGLDVLYVVLAVFLFDGARRVITYVYQTIDKLLVSWLTSDILIDANDEIRDEILAWFAARYNPRFGARSVMVYSGAMKQKRMRHPYLDERMISNNDRETEINFTPSLGRHYFFPLGWRPFIFEREGKEYTRSWSQQASQDITIRCFGWSDQPLKDFLILCKEFKKEKSKGRTMTYTYSTERSSYDGGHWGSPYAAPSRDLATVELAAEIKDDIVRDITRYLEPKTAEFYKNNGIPYRRGYLFHGPPGTGKSSLSKALASNFGLALYCMNLGEEGIGDRDLRSAFGALPTKCIVLLEDIDSAGIGREKPSESQEEKDASKNAALAGLLAGGLDDDFGDFMPRSRGLARVTLSGLLNALDGASASEGRIVIMTSNFPEVLDSALIRPGRVDKRVLLPDMSRTSATKIFSRMYSHCGVEKLDTLAAVFASRLPDGKITPAELQGFILDHMDEPMAAVEKVESWAEGIIDEKNKEQERKDARKKAKEEAKAQKVAKAALPVIEVGANGVTKEKKMSAGAASNGVVGEQQAAPGTVFDGFTEEKQAGAGAISNGAAEVEDADAGTDADADSDDGSEGTSSANSSTTTDGGDANGGEGVTNGWNTIPRKPNRLRGTPFLGRGGRATNMFVGRGGRGQGSRGGFRGRSGPRPLHVGDY